MGKTIGYVYQPIPELTDLALIWTSRSIEALDGLMDETVQSVMQNVKDSIGQARSMGDKLREKGADDVVVFFNRSKEQAWKDFIDGMAPGTKVLVSDYDQISLDPRTKLNHLNTAKDKNILVLAVEQSDLLALDLVVAFNLLQAWVIRDIETEMSEDRRNPDADYERLRDLMNKGLSVTQIMEQTGWSRSTVFRNRRIHYKDLCRDVPKFRSKGFKVEED
jgi:hypothetical protein